MPFDSLPSAQDLLWQKTSQPTIRHFVDNFPMFLARDCPSFSPVVTFTDIQGAEATLTGFVNHLQESLALFRQPFEFRFLYLARADSHVKNAAA
jgi:hypothetical protein